MGFDLYNVDVDEILNIKLDRLAFQVKMRQLDEKLDREFVKSLFNSLAGGNYEITVRKIFDIFNINKDESYKTLANEREPSLDLCLRNIPKYCTYKELKQKFLSLDQKVSGRIPYNSFMAEMRKYLKGKISDTSLIHLLRTNKYIDDRNYVDYHRFLLLIFIDVKEDTWARCLEEFQKFLHDECNDDLFIFIVKINNMSNNTNIKKTISVDRMFEFFRGRVDMLEMPVMWKFDYDQDGVISMDDLANIIKNYIDSHYFDDKKKISMDSRIKSEKLKYNENKNIYLTIKEALNNINMTEDNLFYYLDKNRDNFIDIKEFTSQIMKLPLSKKYTQKQLDMFYTFFDEYNNGKVDINIFKNKLRIFKDDIRDHNENGYIGNPTIENLILTEFSKWFLKNNHLCDTELFSILDNDHDGQISINDLKVFAINTLLMPSNELDDTKILRFIEAVSLTKNNNLVLADIQNLMQCVNFNDIQKFRKNIHHFCNEGVNKSNKDPEWIKDVIDKIGMFLNENYKNDIESFYDDYDVTNFRNQGQGLSFDNFINFLEKNYKLFEPYHINKNQQLVLFNHISGNKKFITIDNLKKMFSNSVNYPNTIYNNKTNDNQPIIKDSPNYDYYGQMHNDIIIFLHENFPKCEDAFKYFHRVKTFNQERPTFNDKNSENNFITKKEFFDGINRMFPNKYQTEAILHYYNTTFKKDPNNGIEANKIKYSEFNYVYYGEFTFDSKFNTTLNNKSKILTTRPNTAGIPFMTFNSPFPVKEHKKLETPYDLDPLDKIKRLILSSKIDFKTEFGKFIQESGNGMANQFEFRNMIKKLDLGLTNIEIEDIINKSGITSDGYINLVDFYKYITDENKNLVISKRHILEQLKEFKQLIYKYYSNPRLAFELNDPEVQGFIDFDKFKKIVYDVYKREVQPMPSYPVMKYVYDYIDIRKDGIIDLNEWSKVFAQAEGKLDVSNVRPSQMKVLREWETSRDIIEVYKLIARNKKLIRDKVKLFTVGSNVMLILDTNLIDILKNVLGKIRLSQTQWKMIVALGVKDKSRMIDFDAFIKVIEATSKMERSHPIQKK